MTRAEQRLVVVEPHEIELGRHYRRQGRREGQLVAGQAEGGDQRSAAEHLGVRFASVGAPCHTSCS